MRFLGSSFRLVGTLVVLAFVLAAALGADCRRVPRASSSGKQAAVEPGEMLREHGGESGTPGPEGRPTTGGLPSSVAPDPEDESPNIRSWESVDDLPRKLAVFRSVFWAPEDTASLRDWIRTHRDIVQGSMVLEIGTGSGLVALCFLQAGARRVVATDVNPEALANARYNAERLGMADRLETRWVPLDRPGAYQVIRADETFDVIVSNPPWEDAQPKRMEDYAFYDPGFLLLDSLIVQGQAHLRPGGRILLAYGCVAAIRRAAAKASEAGLQCTMWDKRKLDELPPVFVPGLLMELSPLDTN